MFRPCRFRARLLVWVMLVAYVAPAIALACVPMGSGMTAMPFVVDATQELPGGG